MQGHEKHFSTGCAVLQPPKKPFFGTCEGMQMPKKTLSIPCECLQAYKIIFLVKKKGMQEDEKRVFGGGMTSDEMNLLSFIKSKIPENNSEIF